jgi:cell shape-determining protein MreC
LYACGGKPRTILCPITSCFPESFNGAALSPVQGLNQEVESGKQKAESRMEKLEAENAELKKRLERLEQLLAAKDGGAQ